MSHKIQHKTPFFSPFSGGQYAPNSPVETCFKDFLNKNTNAVVSDSDIDFLKSIKILQDSWDVQIQQPKNSKTSTSISLSR